MHAVPALAAVGALAVAGCGSSSTKTVRTTPRFRSKAAGSVIYRDALSSPQRAINWDISANAYYSGGGLTLSVPGGAVLTTGPVTNFTFSYDARHVTVQVDAVQTRGSGYFGIICPALVGRPSTSVAGQLAPNGAPAFSQINLRGSAFLLRVIPPPGVSANKPVANPKVFNHLRLDCDQYSPGLMTMRLYVNGIYAGASSAAVQLERRSAPGLVVASSRATAAAVFKNWSVSTLPGS